MGLRIYRTVAVLVLLSTVTPLTHTSASADTYSLAEDVAALKEFRQQQREWNTWIDRRVSTDMQTSQGVQDARMSAIEEKLNAIASQQMVIYAFGGVGSLIFGVGTPIAWSAYSKKHSQIARYQRKLERLYHIAGYEVPADVEEMEQE